MCSPPALIKSLPLPERCMEHSCWGQVHQAKCISLYHNQFCTAVSRSWKPAGRMSQSAQMRGREQAGTGNAGIGYGSVKWRHSPAAWPSYNIKVTVIKWPRTMGLHVSVPLLFHKDSTLKCHKVCFFKIQKNMSKNENWEQCIKTTRRAGSAKTRSSSLSDWNKITKKYQICETQDELCILSLLLMRLIVKLFFFSQVKAIQNAFRNQYLQFWLTE